MKAIEPMTRFKALPWPLFKWVMATTATRWRAAISASGARTPRTSLLLWLSVAPRNAETGSTITKRQGVARRMSSSS